MNPSGLAARFVVKEDALLRVVSLPTRWERFIYTLEVVIALRRMRHRGALPRLGHLPGFRNRPYTYQAHRVALAEAKFVTPLHGINE